MEEYEKMLTIGDNQFLLKYLGSYQVEVFSCKFQYGSRMYDKNEWESPEPPSIPPVDMAILEKACEVLIDWNLKKPGFLFNESAGSL